MKTTRIILNKDICIDENCLILTRRIIKNGDVKYALFNLSIDENELYFKTNFHSEEFDFVILKNVT